MDEINLDKLEDIEEISVKDLYAIIYKMKDDIKFINKNCKKSIMSIESLKEDINKSSEQNFRLKKELEENKYNEIKIYKKIISLLDQLDNIYKFAYNLESKEFLQNLNLIKMIVRKEMSEIHLVEINSLGELFNPDIHKCIAIEKYSSKEYNQIISVIENGYMLRGKVIRPASVIIAR